MSNNTLLLIDGLPASGKSLIRGMLDGHERVFMSPYHDLLPLAFCNKNINKELFDSKDIEWLRKVIVCNSRYSRIERIASQEFFEFEFGAGQFQKINLSFNFAKFEENWKKKILFDDNLIWSPHSIVASIYKELEKCLVSTNNNVLSNDFKILGTLGNGEIKNFKNFLKQYESGKIIFVKRNPIQIIAALSSRGNYQSIADSINKNQEILFRHYIEINYLRHIENVYNEIKKISNFYQDRILLINFEDIFKNFNLIKESICEFLKIKKVESLNIFTVNKDLVLQKDGNSLFRSKLDNPEILLTKKQYQIAYSLSKGFFKIPIGLYPTRIRYKLIILFNFLKRGLVKLKGCIVYNE